MTIGTGVVSSIGFGAQEYFDSLKTGICNIKKSNFGSIVVPTALVYIEKTGLQGKSRKIAVYAFEEAVTNVGMAPKQISSPRTGLVVWTMNSTASPIAGQGILRFPAYE